MQEIETAVEEKKAQVIYFGDSSNYQTSPRDPYKRSIDQWIQNYTPQYRLGSMAHAGYASDVFLAHAHYLLKKRPLPKAIIVPINLGSFGPVWERNPQFQFNEEKLILSENPLAYVFYRPLKIFKYTDRISQEEFEMTPVYKGRQLIGMVKDFYNEDYQKHVTEQKIKNRMAFRYMYALDPQHRKVKALVEIARLMKKHHIQPIFYVGAIDWETGERHWPDEFLSQVQENVSLLNSQLREENITFVDLSTRLGDEAFIDGDYPQEHINEEGRRLVAKEISDTLKRVLTNAI